MICSVPWYKMYIGSGWIMNCCSGDQESLTRASSCQTVSELIDEGRPFLWSMWNSEYFQTLRGSMALLGPDKSCGESSGRSCIAREGIPFSDPHISLTELQIANSALAEESFRAGEIEVSHCPVEMYLILDVICNFDCIMCHQRSLREAGIYNQLKVNRFQDELGEFIQKAVRFGIQGGETTLSPAYPIIMDVARSVGGRLDVMTNGSTLETAVIPKLPQIHTLQLSVDAATQETYSSIRRGGNWPLLLAGLEMTRQEIDAGDHPVRMEFRNVLMRSNMHEIVGMVELAKRFGGSVILEDIEWLDHNQDLSHLMFTEQDIPALNFNLDAALGVARELEVEVYYTVRAAARSGWQPKMLPAQPVEGTE